MTTTNVQCFRCFTNYNVRLHQYAWLNGPPFEIYFCDRCYLLAERYTVFYNIEGQNGVLGKDWWEACDTFSFKPPPPACFYLKPNGEPYWHTRGQITDGQHYVTDDLGNVTQIIPCTAPEHESQFVDYTRLF